MPLDFFDRSGNAIAYSEDRVHIYLYNGQALAYLISDAIHLYRGEHLGWYENGWIRDKVGRCVAFSESASGGPPRPGVLPKPSKIARHMRPHTGPRDSRALRPIHSNIWSSLTTQEFFANRPHRWPGSIGGESDNRT